MDLLPFSFFRYLATKFFISIRHFRSGVRGAPGFEPMATNDLQTRKYFAHPHLIGEFALSKGKKEEIGGACCRGINLGGGN